VLVIGSDGERRGAVNNGAAPAGPANSDALMLVRLAPKQPLDVLVLPIEAAIKLPGQSQPVALGSLYRRGGPALVASVTAELLGLPKGQPDRFLVVPRLALRKLVDGLGQVELAPDRSMLYTDRSQSLHIDLQPGLQLLDGDAMEQFLRFREPDGSEEGRRQRLKASLAPLLQQMGHPQQLQQLPDLLRSLQDKVETNLSPNEALSLVAAALQPGTTPRFHSLPLLPPLGAGAGAKPGLRQLAGPVGQSDWPQTRGLPLGIPWETPESALGKHRDPRSGRPGSWSWVGFWSVSRPANQSKGCPNPAGSSLVGQTAEPVCRGGSLSRFAEQPSQGPGAGGAPHQGWRQPSPRPGP
jgi:LCP family protein required for cell wall assembly